MLKSIDPATRIPTTIITFSVVVFRLFGGAFGFGAGPFFFVCAIFLSSCANFHLFYYIFI